MSETLELFKEKSYHEKLEEIKNLQQEIVGLKKEWDGRQEAIVKTVSKLRANNRLVNMTGGSQLSVISAARNYVKTLPDDCVLQCLASDCREIRAIQQKLEEKEELTKQYLMDFLSFFNPNPGRLNVLANSTPGKIDMYFYRGSSVDGDENHAHYGVNLAENTVFARKWGKRSSKTDNGMVAETLYLDRYLEIMSGT